MKKMATILSSVILVVASMSFCHGFEDPMKILFAGKKHPTINQQNLTPRKKLGFFLFFDKNLSNPPGVSCGTCHDPQHGFEDIKDRTESEGAVQGRFSNRNAPSAAYAAFSPYFYYDEKEQTYMGGQFYDGRAGNLAEQAKGPLLNPLEMDNPDNKSVVEKIAAASYAGLFKYVYGPNIFENIDKAYDMACDAIAAFEESAEFNPFSSKYDHYLAGKGKLDAKEKKGLALFEDSKKGNCAACHPSRPTENGFPPLFTDFSYDNLGVPKNPDNPFYTLDKSYNPLGDKYVDLGLGGILKKPSENGKFKVPGLRNVALTAPYMHNGVFKTLKEVVRFYNTRDKGNWPPPEVPKTVNKKELGNLGLTNDEMDAIVAFLNILSDQPIEIDKP
jgi:cytochrome c peroxidase